MMRPTTQTPEPSYKISEVSRYLGETYATTLKRVRSGEIRSIQIGKYWRIPQSAFDEFMASLKKEEARV